MRKSRQEAAATRARIVETASTELRRQGIAGAGLAEIMAAAGLTHGGFYRHFETKDQLVAEALAAALAHQAAKREAERPPLKAIVTQYLSTAHRDAPGQGCPLVSLGAEIARAGATVRAEATSGFEDLVTSLAARRGDLSDTAARDWAVVALSTMVGALTLARIAGDPVLSENILDRARESILQSAGLDAPASRSGPDCHP
jgi:TetR/AcrR family transcriptional repressor of nem operon